MSTESAWRRARARRRLWAARQRRPALLAIALPALALLATAQAQAVARARSRTRARVKLPACWPFPRPPGASVAGQSSQRPWPHLGQGPLCRNGADVQHSVKAKNKVAPAWASWFSGGSSPPLSARSRLRQPRTSATWPALAGFHTGLAFGIGATRSPASRATA